MIDVRMQMIPLNFEQTNYGGYVLIQMKETTSFSTTAGIHTKFYNSLSNPFDPSLPLQHSNSSKNLKKRGSQKEKLEHIQLSFDEERKCVIPSTLLCSPFLASLLARLGASSRHRLLSCQGIDSFCEEMEVLLSRVTLLDSGAFCNNKSNPNYCSNNNSNKNKLKRNDQSNLIHYSEVVRQIEELGWDKIENSDHFPDSIDLSVLIDQSVEFGSTTKRKKELLEKEVGLEREEGKKTMDSERTFRKATSPLYCRVIYSDICPGVVRRIETELPVSFNVVKSDTLLKIYRRLIRLAEKYKITWQLLDDLDKNSYVVEPEGTPTRQDMRRRIRVDSDVSIIFEVDPDFPYAVLDLTFLGPNDKVQVYEHKYVENLSLWDTGLSPRKNIEKVLNLSELPPRPVDGAPPTDGDCCICYLYLLPVEQDIDRKGNMIDDQTQESRSPDISCPEKCCRRNFHRHCLREWFYSLQKTPILGNLTGACPYCQSNITIKI